MFDKQLSHLIECAHKRARHTGEPIYVVWDPCDGKYHLATERELNIFFAGLRDEHILYCAIPDGVFRRPRGGGGFPLGRLRREVLGGNPLPP